MCKIILFADKSWLHPPPRGIKVCIPNLNLISVTYVDSTPATPAMANPAPLALWPLLPREGAVELGPWLISLPTWRPVGSLRGPGPWSVGYEQLCDTRSDWSQQTSQDNTTQQHGCHHSAATANYSNNLCDAFSSHFSQFWEQIVMRLIVSAVVFCFQSKPPTSCKTP